MNNAQQAYLKLLRQPLFIVTWLALIIFFGFMVDKPLAIYCQQHVNGTLMACMQWLTNFGYAKWYLIISGSVALLALYFKQRRIAWISGFFFLTIVVSGLSCDVIKVIVSRARPNEWFEHQLYGLQWFKTHASLWSFPSGHTTTIAALLTAISLLWPRTWLPCLIFILLVAGSRVMIGAHYLSDVMAGWYLGTLSSYYLKQYLENKYGIASEAYNTV